MNDVTATLADCSTPVLIYTISSEQRVRSVPELAEAVVIRTAAAAAAARSVIAFMSSAGLTHGAPLSPVIYSIGLVFGDRIIAWLGSAF